MAKVQAEAGKGSVLAALLERNHGRRPDFGGGLSNHLSMGLYSLSAIGADRAELEHFAHSYETRLEPLPTDPGPLLSGNDWKTQLGQRNAINSYRTFYAQQIALHGRAATLRTYLPELLPGIACEAFHALIRTAYGVRFSDDREVADGLAYWAIAFSSLGPLDPAGTERDPLALLESAHKTPSLARGRLPGHLITEQMQAAASLSEFRALAAALAAGESTLPALAAAAVRLYVSTDDFTALHAVTATHAFRVLQPCITNPETGLRYLWQGLLAAYVSIGAPRILLRAVGTLPSWTACLARAKTSLDEHDIKLVDIAHEQALFYSEPLYLVAAARRVKLI